MALDISLVAHEILCAALFYSVFGRAVKSCAKVRTDVRVAFFALGLIACIGMAAPLAWGFIPSPLFLALLAAIVAVQLTTSRHWANGVPSMFIKPEHVPRMRRATDREATQ